MTRQVGSEQSQAPHRTTAPSLGSNAWTPAGPRSGDRDERFESADGFITDDGKVSPQRTRVPLHDGYRTHVLGAASRAVLSEGHAPVMADEDQVGQPERLVKASMKAVWSTSR